jgi:hypothetical protein
MPLDAFCGKQVPTTAYTLRLADAVLLSAQSTNIDRSAAPYSQLLKMRFDVMEMVLCRE